MREPTSLPRPRLSAGSSARREVARAVEARIGVMRRLVLDYAKQHHLAEAGTGLVDIGWTGRMVGSLIQVCEAAGMSRPSVLFWGHEPRPDTGWTDPERVAAYMYNTATGQGLQWRVPNAPFVMETFCMGDHGIVSGYRTDAAGQTEPVLLSPGNDAAEAWGLRLYRSALYAFCAALNADGGLPGDDVRPLVHQVMDAFWCHPTPAEARAWGTYPYDSDPAGTAARPLARPFTSQDRPTRGDRAWLAGSLALSTPEARAAFLRYAPADELAGAPETDLCIVRRWRSPRRGTAPRDLAWRVYPPDGMAGRGPVYRLVRGSRLPAPWPRAAAGDRGRAPPGAASVPGCRRRGRLPGNSCCSRPRP